MLLLTLARILSLTPTRPGHDGIFSTTDAYYSTDELYFVERENGHVTPWEDRAIYEQWNPANHVSKWSTPQLVIHGGKGEPFPSLTIFSRLRG